MRRRQIAVAIAVISFIAFIALGRELGQGPDPAWLLSSEQALVNHGTLLAWWLTWFGYVYVLAPVCVALIVVAWRFPQYRGAVIFSIVALLLAWRGADFFQHYFARPRRLDWVVKHETAFSYPSSHAAIVAGFYFLWSAFLARSSVLGRMWWAAALALLGCGVLWSRLALGAHYLTDVVGGVLWGIAVVSALAALFPINFAEKEDENQERALQMYTP